MTVPKTGLPRFAPGRKTDIFVLAAQQLGMMTFFYPFTNYLSAFSTHNSTFGEYTLWASLFFVATCLTELDLLFSLTIDMPIVLQGKIGGLNTLFEKNKGKWGRFFFIRKGCVAIAVLAAVLIGTYKFTLMRIQFDSTNADWVFFWLACIAAVVILPNFYYIKRRKQF